MVETNQYSSPFTKLYASLNAPQLSNLRLLYISIQVPGSDLALAREIATAAERHGLSEPDVPVAIGSRPPSFRVDATANTTMKDVYELMIFYNDPFGISKEDDVDARHHKLVRFLSHY